MSKKNKVITTVEADPTLSKKAGIFAIANNTTKAEMFILALEFYSEHHQHLLPENLQTPGAVPIANIPAPPPTIQPVSVVPKTESPVKSLPETIPSKAEAEETPDTDAAYQKELKRREERFARWDKAEYERCKDNPYFLEMYVFNKKEELKDLEAFRALGRFPDKQYITLAHFETFDHGTFKYRLDKDDYQYLVNDQGYEPVVKFDENIPRPILREVLSEVKGALPDIYRDQNIFVKKMDKQTLKGYDTSYAESYELIDDE